MRKFWSLAAALVLVLAVAAIAIAQDAVTNTYDVDGSTSPERQGHEEEAGPDRHQLRLLGRRRHDGRRPSPVKKYSIRFDGTQVNTERRARRARRRRSTTRAPTAARRSPSSAPASSRTPTGNRNDPNDTVGRRATPSSAVINSGDRKANIYVKGSPNATDPREKCAIELAAPIPAPVTCARRSDTALEFECRTRSCTRSPTLSNAVKRVQSKIKRLTKRIKRQEARLLRGHRRLRQNGGRAIEVVFTPEEGHATTAAAQGARADRLPAAADV